MMDNMSRTLNKMWKVKRNAVVDENELTWRPSGRVHVEDMADLEVLDPGGMDLGVFKILEDIRRDTEESSGVNDFIMGQYRSSTGFNDTATGISLIQQIALKRTGHKGQILQRAIRDIGQQTFTLIAQFQPFGTTIRVLDRDAALQYRFTDISPQALRYQYDFHIVNAASLGSKPMRQNQLVQLLQILLPLAQQGGSPLDLRAFTRRLLEEMDIPNPNELLGHPGLNMPIPQLQTPEEQGDFISPNEENRLMIDQHKMVYPKNGEPHPFHIFAHMEAHDMISDEDAKHLLSEHAALHQSLMETEKQLLATQMGAQADAQSIGATMQMAQNAGKRPGTKSPNQAGGQEQATREMGQLLAGAI